MIDARSNSLSIGSHHNKLYIVIVCLITLTAFLVNTFSCNLAWADRAPSELTSVGSDRAVSPVSPGLIKELKAKTFVLPQSLGMVKDSWSAHPGAATVIQIQDAHCNYGAQKKIADIIAYINENYGISSINLEGGAGKYDLAVFTDIPDKRVREKTADYFVKEGLINGAEYFAINNPDKAVLLGIEDPKLYVENLKVYRNSLLYKEDVESSLKSLSYILTNLKIKIYSRELLEFDIKYSQFKADNMEFKDYLAYLLGEAKAKSIDIKPYNNISLLSRAEQAEAAIDFNKANNERDELIDVLQKKLSKNAMEDLVAKTVEFKRENIAQKDFYDYLVEKAGKLNIDLKSLPELSKYIGYISLYEAMDKSKVMDESEALESKIKDTMLENDGRRELARLSKNLAIMKNIFNISLTRDDYRYYKAHEGEFAIGNYQSFIRDNAPRYHLNAVLWPNIDKIDRYREDISKFYEYSFKRDEAFLRNITYGQGSSSMVNRQKPAATILITGGFHTDNLCEMFRKQGISYITILPNFANDKGYESPYFTLLSGREKGMIEKLNTIISSALMQIASMLSEMAPDAWGDSGVNAFKAAVYVQSLVEQGRKVRITGNGVPAEGLVFGEGEAIEITVTELLQRVKSVAPMSTAGIILSSMNMVQSGVAPDALTLLTGVKRPGTEVWPLEAPPAAPQVTPSAATPIISVASRAAQQEPPIIRPSVVATLATETARKKIKLQNSFDAFKISARESDWVVKFDGPRIRATNDIYGSEATDWFVAEIIKQTVIDFALYNNIPAEVGGKGSEEFAFCFPARLSENDIRIKMDALMQSFKDKCGLYLVSTLNAKLNASQISELKNAGARFVYSVGAEGQEKVRTKIIFDKTVVCEIRDLLRARGQTLESLEGLRVPYPVTALTRLGANNDFREAYLMAGRWQEQYKNTPIEDGGELLIFGPPALKAEKEKAQMELEVTPERRSEIENAVSGYGTNLNTGYEIENIYGVYHRDSLGRLLKDLHNMPLSKRRSGTYFIRGPPNEFYAINVKTDGSFELIKLDTLFFASDPKIAKQFNRILASGRAPFNAKYDAREMFGFKAINTVFGHDGGNFVIKAIRYGLERAFDEHRDASLEEKTDLAVGELNRLFNDSGFGCFIIASHITEREAGDNEGYKDFIDSAITSVDDLIRARDVWVHKATSGDSIVKRYSEYKHMGLEIADNLELAKYYNMIFGEDIVAGVDRNLAVKAQYLHEAIGRIPFDMPLELILRSGDYLPGAYRTEVTVGEGTVAIAEYDKDGIVMGTVRTLSAGGSETIIARVGYGDILLQSPGRVTKTYSAGTYRTQVIVHEGFVSVQTYDENGAVTGDKVLLRTGQNASIVGRIVDSTSASYLAELTGKAGALEGITTKEPIAGPGSATGWDSKGYFDVLSRFGISDYSNVERMKAYLSQMKFWFGTNEADWDKSLNEMRGRSGAYLDIAYGGQNLSRLSHGNFDKAIIIDSNPFVTEIFMPIRAALITLARSRAEYLGLLSGVRLEAEEMDKLRDAPLRDIANYIIAKAKDAGDTTVLLREKTWESIRGQFPAYLKEPASLFWNEYSPGKFELSQMVKAMAGKESWLANEENFGKIQNMTRSGNIIGITGDWTDENKMTNVAKYMGETGLKASVIYDSNIVEHIYKISDPAEREKAIKARIDNLHRLPITDNAIFLDVNVSGKTTIIRSIPMSEGEIAKPVVASVVAPVPITPVDNVALIEAAKAVISDISRGTADIIVMPGSDIYLPAQTAVNRNAVRRLNREYGQDTVPYCYKFGDNWKENLLVEGGVLSKAMSELKDRIDSGDNTARGIIFVPFEGEGVAAIKDAIASAYPQLSGSVSVIGETGIPSSGMIDNIMHIVLGKGLLNYSRQGEKKDTDFEKRLEDLIKLLVSDPEAIDMVKDPGVINNILNGLVPLRIKPIDFKEIEEWKKMQDAVLMSL